MPYTFLHTRRDGPVEHLTLDRPDIRNALDDRIVDEITRWADAVATDGRVRVVVLAGAGPAFCAGADLSWMRTAAAYTQDENRRDAEAMARMYLALDRLPIPLLGRVHRAALGGGAGLAAVCDLVVADDQAVFGFTEVKLGIVPAVIAPYVIAKIGVSAARELFVTGRRFDAARAREIGLVHTVVPMAQLDGQVEACVRELLSAGPEAIAAAKALIRAVAHRSAADVAALTADVIATRRVSAEGQEGLAAFLEKRTPSWSDVPPRSDR